MSRPHHHRQYADTPCPPSARSCWVCGIEQDFIQEPSLLRHALNFAESGALARIIFSACSFIALVNILPSPQAVQADQTSGADSDKGSLLTLATLVQTLKFGASVIAAVLATMIWNVQSLPDNAITEESHMKSRITIPEDNATKNRLANILSDTIQCRTVSYDLFDKERKADYSQLDKLHGVLRRSFPVVHQSQHIDVQVVNKYSLIYTWQGSDKALKPVMLCAHLDVVPAEGTDLDLWDKDKDPFAGEIDDNGYIWGRGAIDCKNNVIMQLYAIEHLIASGEITQPTRTVVLCFGHDEEIGGDAGAQSIAATLSQRPGVKAGEKFRAEFILDEGAFVVNKMLKGVDIPVALICNCEKGAVDYRLTCDTYPSGHSSSPAAESNVGMLARAIHRLESHPFRIDQNRIAEPFRYFATSLAFPLRVVIANMWFFGPLVKFAAARDPKMAQVGRTTTAVTIVRAGTKYNTVPSQATAHVNHRIMPPMNTRMENPDEILRYDREVINDKRVKIEQIEGKEWTPPSPVSSIESRAFKLLRQATRDIHGMVASSHFIMTGNTDTRHYWELADDIYRFSPILLDRKDIAMFHGPNEKISSINLVRGAQFYEHIIKSACEWGDA